jgi:hypothetical protein
MSERFFEDLQGFSDFSDISNVAHYKAVPQDWHVIVTDVENSTQAIENGRYKDVNMVGAACIASVVNVCGDIKIPYVFGGDGATFLVPSSCVEKVKKDLIAVKRYALKMYNLQLRVGEVLVEKIKECNKNIAVAKYEFPTGQCIAMFNGGGLAHADALIKSDERFLVYSQETDKHEPSLDGLSCRWKPIPAERGTMLSMLVMALGEPDEQTDVYQEVSSFLEDTLEKCQNPAANGNLSYKWPGRETLRQAQIVWRRGNRALNLLRHIIEIKMINLMNRFNWSVKGFDFPAYKEDMVMNSDYRKFDDMLRMVIDCSLEQAKQIEHFLSDMHANGKLVYGTHYSDTALMTCFVQNLESQGHTHFIDGHDGGYAMAARGLKQQLKELKCKG